MSSDIVTQSAVELVKALASGELSSAEVVEAHIQQVEAVNRQLNAVVFPMFDQAREMARQLDNRRARGSSLGALHGLPVTIKDMFDLQGAPTTAGITTRSGHRAISDADAVARFRQAGAIPLGKTNIPMMGMKSSSENPLYGSTKNPWNLDRTPGGSSGGESAIIAAGGSPLGLGSDGGGSIRWPCHSCGIAGLKPTSRRLSFRGHWSLPNFLDDWAQPGPMARHVHDLDLAMQVLCQPPASNPGGGDSPNAPIGDFRKVRLDQLKVGYYTQLSWLKPMRTAQRAVEETIGQLQRAGVDVQVFDPPNVDHAMGLYFGIFYADALQFVRRQLRGAELDNDFRRYILLSRMPTSARQVMSRIFAWRGQRSMSDTLRYMRKRVRSTPEYLELLNHQKDYRERFIAALDAAEIDALIGPPNPMPAYRHGEFYSNYSLIYTSLYNLLGLPAGVVPVTTVRKSEGKSDSRGSDYVERCFARTIRGSVGLPVGVQVVARWWREDVVLAIMSEIESHVRSNSDFPKTPTPCAWGTQ